MKKLFVIANWMQGTALSGGDRIFIELVKRWSSKFQITLFLSKEGAAICKRQNLRNLSVIIWSSGLLTGISYFINYSYRTCTGIYKSFFAPLAPGDLVISTSDFWPDSLPAFFMKLRKPKITWAAGFFLFAPKPWKKNNPYTGKLWIKGFLFWLTQQFSYYFIKHFADVVLVESEPDIKPFITDKRPSSKILAIRGGVDLAPSKAYLKLPGGSNFKGRTYDACFVGRLHYQKGVLLLPKIWKEVFNKYPHARLAVIGTGPLEEQLRSEIGHLGLEKNIDLLGFRDHKPKYEIFKQSKLVLHPATYDSGGMAAAEAMAWGLPGVSFDLEALKTCYPKGMVKTKCFEISEFAENILKLIMDQSYYELNSREALELIEEKWNWDHRAEWVYNQIVNHSSKTK